MKRTFGAFLLCLAMLVCAEEKIVPAGTYGNLLQNGKLEILEGNFPGPWRLNEGRCSFVPESAPGGGGLFRIGKGKAVIIRQDWTFTLTEKLQYRLSAKVRTSADYKADSAVIMVFNNGWSKSESVKVEPSADTGWRTISGIITAPASRGGLYSAAVMTQNVRSGTVEFADITLEPATEKAQNAQTEWLKDVPLRKLHIFGIHKGILLSDGISGRWYGKKPTKTEYAFDQRKYAAFKMDENGSFTFPSVPEKPGKHILKVRIDGKEYEYSFLKQVSPYRKKYLNNLNVQIAELKMAPGKKENFTLDREAPVRFRTEPGNLVLTVDGGKKMLKNGSWIRLKEGTHTVQSSVAGKVYVQRLADTVFYQLGSGPYFKSMPQNNLAFARNNMMDAVTVYFNPAVPANLVAKEIRPYGAVVLGMCSMGSFKKFDPSSSVWKNYDGAGVDEYAATSPKTLAEHFSRRKGFKPHTLKIWPWETGSLQNNEIQAELQSTLCDAGDIMLYEAYVKSNFRDEAEARKSMEQKFRKSLSSAEKIHPGFIHNIAMITSHGNIPLSFTTDNNPAVDYKYFLDMQFNIWANDPAFRDLAAVGSWGGNYADRECNAWLAALFRHYVVEGQSSMLSKKYAFTFHPGILENCDFANGVKGWTVKGQVTPGTVDGYCTALKRFGGIPADAESCVTMEEGAVLSQSLKNLKKGQLYRIRILTTGEVPAITLKDVQELSGKRCTFFQKKTPAEKGTDVYFRANGKTGGIVLTASKAKCMVHYLSATPCYEYKEVSEAQDKSVANMHLAKTVKEFLIRRNNPNGPTMFFENMKGTPVTGLSAGLAHDGKTLKMVLTSPAAEKGIWEVHSAAIPAKGDLLLLTVDAQGKVQAQSVIRVSGGMPSARITPLANLASASVSESNGKRIITVTIPMEKIVSYGFVPGKRSHMNFFYITDKQAAGWNPSFKKERRLPWRLGRAYLEK